MLISGNRFVLTEKSVKHTRHYDKPPRPFSVGTGRFGDNILFQISNATVMLSSSSERRTRTVWALRTMDNSDYLPIKESCGEYLERAGI